MTHAPSQGKTIKNLNYSYKVGFGKCPTANKEYLLEILISESQENMMSTEKKLLSPYYFLTASF